MGVGKLVVGPGPHIRDRDDVKTIMWWVVISLMPALIASVLFWGIRPLIMTLISVVVAVGSEYLFSKLFNLPIRIDDGSAVITGILLAFNVTPNAPWWIFAVGSFFAIVFGKMVFGGLGYNPVNPALAGRAFLMASWPVIMTADWIPANFLFKGPMGGIDGFTSATPLNVYKYNQLTIDQLKEALMPLFIGNVGGVLGETSAIALLIGAAILFYKKIISWRIPFTYIGTVFILAWIFQKSGAQFTKDFWVEPMFHVLAGGLILGAFFMATDMVTSPITPKGQIIFGVGLGVLTYLIRRLGGYPEGVSYSILLMNLTVPFLNKLTIPRIFGHKDKK